jgi:hypothetical protein
MNGFNDDSTTLSDRDLVRRIMHTRCAPLVVVEDSIATNEEIEAIIDRNKIPHPEE